jgi:hypothetical protein
LALPYLCDVLRDANEAVGVDAETAVLDEVLGHSARVAMRRADLAEDTGGEDDGVGRFQLGDGSVCRRPAPGQV